MEVLILDKQLISQLINQNQSEEMTKQCLVGSYTILET